MTLTTRLMALFVLLTTIPLVIVGYLAYDNGRRTIEQETLNRLTSTTIFKQNEFERWVEGNERSLRGLASRPLIREYAAVLAAQDPAGPEYLAAYASLIEDHLSPNLEEAGGFRDLSILRGDDGFVLISTHEAHEGKYRESEPYFVEGKSRTYVENVSYSLSHGEAVIYVGTPIQDREGDPSTGSGQALIAVLTGHVDLAEVSGIMGQRSGLSQTEDTYLVNKFNFFVTEPRFGEGYALEKALHTDGVEACLGHNEGIGFYDDYRGVSVIGAYRWIPERELCILTEVDQAEAFAPIVALRNTVVVIGLAVTLGAVLLGGFFARTITRPIHQLVRGAGEIGRGNLDYQIGVRGRDEIGQLATAFNEMAADLRHSLGETAHGQRMVLALSQAAQAVQRARTPDEVYQTVGDEVVNLGYHTIIFSLTADRMHLTISHLTFEPGLLQAAEKLAGVTAEAYRQEIVPGSSYEKVITTGQAIFSDQPRESMAELLPRLARPLAGQIAAHLRVEQSIYAPLTSGDEVTGLLWVTGAGLTEADVPAVTAFANQAAIALENARLYGEARAQAEELRKHRDHLEELVDERAAEIKRTNEELIIEVSERKRVGEELRGTLEELGASQTATLNMMLDAEEARRLAEQANAELIIEVSERKRAQADLERSNRELEQFAYVASHDLQEPLRMVSSYTQLLASRYKDQLDADANDFINFAVDGATRMQRLINELLTFSRVSTRGNPFEKTYCEVVIDQALDNLRLTIEDSGAVITNDPLPTVMADGVQLGQLFQNLIGNAIKFRSDEPLRVHVGVERKGDEWVFSVRDNGIGIDPRYHERIFVIFQRLHRKEEYPGTGIGLAICKRIVERHSGRIWLESEPGEGSTFYFTIPMIARR